MWETVDGLFADKYNNKICYKVLNMYNFVSFHYAYATAT